MVLWIETHAKSLRGLCGNIWFEKISRGWCEVCEWMSNICSSYRSALETIDRLTDSLDLSDYASRIIHPLVRTMDTTPVLHVTCMDTLCTLVIQLSHKFTIFIPMVTKVMHRHRITHQRFHMLMARILKVSSRMLRFDQCRVTYEGRQCRITSGINADLLL